MNAASGTGCNRCSSKLSASAGIRLVSRCTRVLTFTQNALEHLLERVILLACN